ncbi:MAG: HIT family protein [Chloroflexota bacterium]
MDTLWAPWRIDYIKGSKPVGCIFCACLNVEDDEENLVVHRGSRCFVILNRYPYTNGHLMVVPFIHEPTIETLDMETLVELMGLTRLSLAVLRNAMHPGGFNIGINQGEAAGAGVADHVHLHVVPRWAGDTNFMPVLSETRVMPQSLESVYQLLARGFALERPAPGK